MLFYSKNVKFFILFFHWNAKKTMLQIDPSIIAIILIVWILVVVLTKTVFNPVRKKMHERENGIASDREAGENADLHHDENLRKIEADIKKTRASAFAMRDSLEKQAQLEKEKLLTEVAQECRIQVNEARQELQKQVQDLKTALKKESDRLAENIEERLLK